MRAALFLAFVAFANCSDYPPIVLPGLGRSGPARLALFVPGGKVPPQDYAPFLLQMQRSSSTNLHAVIVHCGQLNLCDPLGELSGEIAAAIAAANKEASTVFAPESIFVMGHSLGGVGARHYADTFNAKKGAAAFSGLALYGSRFNGDHEDFHGTLGYPVNLGHFPAPLLALLGELDMQPTSHAALLYSQYIGLSSAEKAEKPVVIIPGMDHSQFCSPFNVSGDLRPEISNELATHYASTVTAAWVDAQQPSSLAATAAAEILGSWVENSTAPITAAWRAARAAEDSGVCEAAQRVIMGSLPSDRVRVNVVTVRGSALLEHNHTKYELDAAGLLTLKAVSYPYYPQNSSWSPTAIFAPTYSSASDVSCKLVSADRIAQQLNISGGFPQSSPPVGCSAINEHVVKQALELLDTHWPAASTRFKARGRPFSFEDDSSTYAGPQCALPPHDTTQHTMLRHTTPHDATPCHTMPRHTTQRPAAPRYTTQRHATRYTTPHFATPHHTTTHHATLCRATPGHAATRYPLHPTLSSHLTQPPTPRTTALRARLRHNANFTRTLTPPRPNRIPRAIMSTPRHITAPTPQNTRTLTPTPTPTPAPVSTLTPHVHGHATAQKVPMRTPTPSRKNAYAHANTPA